MPNKTGRGDPLDSPGNVCYAEEKEQAGNGPSRRHIQGSKIAKGLQNFKVLVNWEPFYEKKIEKRLTQPKKS